MQKVSFSLTSSVVADWVRSSIAPTGTSLQQLVPAVVVDVAVNGHAFSANRAKEIPHSVIGCIVVRSVDRVEQPAKLGFEGMGSGVSASSSEQKSSDGKNFQEEEVFRYRFVHHRDPGAVLFQELVVFPKFLKVLDLRQNCRWPWIALSRSRDPGLSQG